MRIDWWTLGLQAVNAIVLIWLLGHFLFRPVAAIIATRQQAAAKLLADADAARAQAESERSAAEALRKDVASKREAMLDAATGEAAKAREEFVAAAKAEADTLRQAAAAEREKHRDEADRESRRQAARLAVAIARRLLDRLPAAMQVLPFLPGLGEAIDALPEESRAALASADLMVRVPRALDESETAQLNDLVSAKLATDRTPAVTVDPAVLAGVELEGPHAVATNSLRADLDRIARELSHDG
ncbi:F0F1 ATP synthase subunit B family protein [Stakelama tenebrarum]|uniref:ATP synthase subunit b n=1 Tax=Stakelama tenebrarum TaxID=2711215 RepID=A0A6G6Y207_9SPHN|nr:hypothetical protein [Sphingosinithalassobacter tenebrarum]QIG78871.1 hypothetical protein G5C33_03060 [Sphingosinithalassobacter tenebrarum]